MYAVCREPVFALGRRTAAFLKMRSEIDRAKLNAFMTSLGQRVSGAGRIYLIRAIRG